MAVPKDIEPVKADDSSKNDSGKQKSKQKDKKEDRNEMTEEDRKLKEDLELLVTRLGESNTELYVPTLEMLKSIIRSSTTSMTSVPKPLKFLRPHYPKLKDLHTSMPEGEWKHMLADILSVLAMC
uniref:RPN1 N-terminal domain-containing protein n=1 Tax=Panagrolaimus sp. PS1159 TaxID=55785 RepID=A0AC35GR31_9BILA